MKNKSKKLLAFFIVLAVGFSSLNGIAIAANNQVNLTSDVQGGTQLPKNQKVGFHQWGAWTRTLV